MQSGGGSTRTNGSARTASRTTSRTRAGGMAEVHAQVDPLPVCRRRAAEVHDRAARDGGVRDQRQVAVLGDDGGRPPADLADLAGDAVVHADPVADLEVTLELQRQPGHDVAQRLLQRQADDGGREDRGREHLGHVDLGPGQDHQRRDEVGDPLHEVAQDAGDLAADQHHVEQQQPADDDDREREQQHGQQAQPVVVRGRRRRADGRPPAPPGRPGSCRRRRCPALTRPRSLPGTTRRSRKRTGSNATAMTGSDPWADHSCARCDGNRISVSRSGSAPKTRRMPLLMRLREPRS